MKSFFNSRGSINQVVKNGTCVAEEKCTPCDNEGHYPGDKWNPDQCTECSCTKASVHCQRIQCPQESICKRGFKSVTVLGTESDCCPKVICGELFFKHQIKAITTSEY